MTAQAREKLGTGILIPPLQWTRDLWRTKERASSRHWETSVAGTCWTARDAHVVAIGPDGVPERSRYSRNNIVDVSVRDNFGLHLAEARIFGIQNQTGPRFHGRLNGAASRATCSQGLRFSEWLPDDPGPLPEGGHLVPEE